MHIDNRNAIIYGVISQYKSGVFSEEGQVVNLPPTEVGTKMIFLIVTALVSANHLFKTIV